VSTETLAVIAAAVLGSSVIAAVIGWVRDRRKDQAITESTSVSALAEAVTVLRTEVREAREEAAAARAETARLRAENTALLRRIRELENGQPPG